MSPRQRNRRREKRRIIRLDRIDVYVEGRSVVALAEPVFKARRYYERSQRYRVPIPPVCRVVSERWSHAAFIDAMIKADTKNDRRDWTPVPAPPLGGTP